jgi:hypothetical protein
MRHAEGEIADLLDELPFNDSNGFLICFAVVEISGCTRYFLPSLFCIAQTAFNGDPKERFADG